MSTACVPTRGSVRMDTLDSVLASIHGRWIERIAPALSSAGGTPTDLRERWAVFHRLGGHFDSWFRLECALAESLASTLEPNAAAALASAREGLEEARDEFTTADWQYATEREVAVLPRCLLKETQRWCAALEFATAGLTLADLTEAGRELLDRIDATAAT